MGVTRPAAQARALVEALTRAGHEPQVVPLVRIGAPADGGRALAAALDATVAGDWVVLTSPNGVAAVADRLVALAESGVRVAAVGPATATRCRQAGAEADVVPKRFCGRALAEALTAGGPAGRAVLAVSARAGDAVADVLGASGWEAVRVDAYDTVAVTPTPDELDALVSCEVITLTSGSAAESLAAAVAGRAADARRAAALAGRSAPAAPPVVCLGAPTARAARSVGLDVVAIADPSTLEGLVAAVSATLAPRGGQRGRR